VVEVSKISDKDLVQFIMDWYELDRIQLKVEIFLYKSKGAEKDTSFCSFPSLSSFL
jgi:hypothetical protein